MVEDPHRYAAEDLRAPREPTTTASAPSLAATASIVDQMLSSAAAVSGSALSPAFRARAAPSSASWEASAFSCTLTSSRASRRYSAGIPARLAASTEPTGCHARFVSPRRTCPACSKRCLRRLHRVRSARPSPLGGGGAWAGRSEHAADPRRGAGRRGDARDDSGALGPGLHPVIRRRQAPAGGGPGL
jgi:hypothetical protein